MLTYKIDLDSIVRCISKGNGNVNVRSELLMPLCTIRVPDIELNHLPRDYYPGKYIAIQQRREK